MNDREQVAKLGEKLPADLEVPTRAEDMERLAQPPSKKLSELDKLELQNAFLKFHAVMLQRTNIKTQMEVLRRDAATADAETQKTQNALAAKRAQIEEKYGVDLQKVTIDEEGVFIPMDPSKMPFPVQGPTNGGN